MTIDWTPKARAVLTAASELFYERGIHAVGVDVIAAKAGVTKKTLYDRFGSKDRLVVEYLSARDARWREFLGEWLEKAGTTPRERLAAVFDASEAWAEKYGGKGCSMINAHAEISDPARPAYAVMTESKQWLLGVLVEVAESAGVSEPHKVAEQIMLLHEGAIVMAGMRVAENIFARAAETAAVLLG
ncbi:TetR/AcrR family transcriptional regulator [Amycolatopsis rubida]|uniref:Regulatory protein, tetR family n=1 Tax=Amycolatopsis rubida TaxID=112413 RepID=A0A1I5TZQ1_9PSEU|nr:helix-turn-helix domain-containing protein [Amycolatopsis rubida]SFP88518.1 regulatory protein, tetR family [Amycolatopsis rubida]